MGDKNLSFVNPEWGGPFHWVKNAAGRLTLQKLPVPDEEYFSVGPIMVP